MDLATFQNLPTEKIAQLVRANGQKVCVFPINGTRRWFMLEHPTQATGDFMATYTRVTLQRHIELYKLLFDHGIDSLLTPILGPDILERGGAYIQMLESWLLWLSQNQELLDFYEEYNVRVRIYGDYEPYLRDKLSTATLQTLDELAQRTAHHQRHRLFFGICAHDATERVAEIGFQFYQKHGRLPNKQEIVTAYYGESVAPVDLFIGFDRPAAFDMPLIATGSEDLYFTVSPSLYLNAYTLRSILYDHLYSRPVSESYTKLSPEIWFTIRDFYQLNRHHVLGVGRRSTDGSFWYPLPQVKLPPQLASVSTNQ